MIDQIKVGDIVILEVELKFSNQPMKPKKGELGAVVKIDDSMMMTRMYVVQFMNGQEYALFGSEIVPFKPNAPKQIETCVCHSRDLLNYGCKCGYFKLSMKKVG